MTPFARVGFAPDGYDGRVFDARPARRHLPPEKPHQQRHLIPQSSRERLPGLLARCALKDESAFEAVYRLCSPKLFDVAIRITRRKDWAEEVLQESFVSIWHHAGRYDMGRSAPMTWMTTIVRNRALDWLRRPREVEAGETNDELLASIPDDGPGPEELVRRAKDASRLAKCLRSLPCEQQRAITLAFFYGLSHHELSVKLDRPLGTVKTWIRRGLVQLQICLEER